jgi:hypothetical protein
VADTPEQLAYELSRATFDNQAETGKRLRDRAAAVLSAASVVIPVAGIAVSHGPHGVAWSFGLAGVAYAFCAYFCGRALLPKSFHPGIAGAEFLDSARESEATLTQMYGSASSYLDEAGETNRATVSQAGDDLVTAIRWLVVELSLLALSLVITIAA